MEFVVDNLVWFIVGGVVILMTIVGYMAEKTDFAGKKYREKVGQEKEKINNKKEQERKEAPKVDAPVQDVTVTDIVSPKIESQNSTKEEDIYDPINNDQVDDISDINEDLYTPLNINHENDIKDIEEDLYVPLVQNNNIPLNMQVEQDIVPEKIIDYETQTGDDVSMDVVENNNEILEQSPMIEGISEPETIVSPIESLDEESETLDMPVVDNIEALPIVDSSDYDKIFPDDPVIINENKENEGTLIEAKEIDNSNAEDIWKF